MMRKALMFFAALAAPSAALTQTVDTGHARLDMTGTAPSACVISAPSTVTGANASFQLTGPQAAQINITQLVDRNTAQPMAASINLSLPIICNSAHTVTVTTSNGGLTRAGGTARNTSSATGFREFLPYRVAALWAGHSVANDSQQQLSIVVGDGAAGELSLTIAVPSGGAPMIAGAYSDSLVIQLQVAS